MRKILLLSFSFVFALSLMAQDRTITGKVTSAEDGSPLPGVNVVVKGTTTGTVTDSDGKYSLSAPQNSVLVFSFIGLKTEEVTIGAKSIVDIQLTTEATQLSEIVVTGAGGLQARERELGTASTIINSDVLSAGKAINMVAGLQGKVPGLNISATSSGVNPNFRIVLRGLRSMTGNNEALIVLDGVIVPSDVIANLNMNDVESTNILRGAGAAALYGSQASNGALIITTKKGKKGKLDITASQNVQFQQVAFYPKFQTKFGSGGSGYGVNPDGSGFYSQYENQSYGPAFDGTDRPLGPPQEALMPDGTTHYQDHTTYSYKNGHEAFWDIGQTNQTNLSISSGDDRGTLFVSGQYVTVTGTTPGDKFTRGNIRVNGTRKITDKFNLSYSVGYAPNSYDISSRTDAIYSNMLNMPSNVDITRYKDWRNTTPGPASIGNPNNFYNPWYQNPYFTADNYREKDKNNFLTGNVELKFTPITGLDLIARQGIAARDYFQKSTVGAFKYSDYAKHTPNSSKTDIPGSDSEISLYTMQSITDFLATYNKEISSFHLQLTGGVQLIENQAKYTTLAVSGLQVPGLYNVSTGLGTPSFGQADIKTRLLGVYGKATVSYRDWLFLTATGRNDWDSRLDPTNRSFFYPSTEVSAVLSDAIPSIKSNILSYLKVRGGISQTGQVNLATTFTLGNVQFSDYGAYALNTTFSSNAQGFPYGSLAGYSINSRLVAKGIKPELTKQYEFGVDANLWKDRITANVTYFHSETSNQTINTGTSWASGFSSLLTNVGVTQSQGIESSLKVTAFKNQDWDVTVGGNYTYLDNTVLSITSLVPSITLATSGNAASQVFAGKAFPVITGYDYVRDPQGRVVVNKDTGLPTQTSDIKVLGNATPKHVLGMNAAASYKNWSFSILFEYRGGYSVYNGVGPELDWSGTGYRTGIYNRQSFIFPNSVIKNSDGTYSQNTSVAISNGNGNNGFWSDGINRQVTSNYVTSGNFVKLREVSLGYNLTSLVNKLGNKFIKKADISVQGRNLFLWMAKDNYYTDPEYSLATGSGRNGTGLNDLSSTPPVRYYGATLNLSF